MKVRHFGPPKSALPSAQTAPQAPVASARVEVASGKGASTEVTLEGGALQFPRVQGLADKAKVDRAIALLQTLRAPEGDAFGGKVRGGVDVAATLRSYYRALEIAPLATAAGGGDAVARFVETLDLPDDIRPLVGIAVGEAVTGGPLGSVSTWENEGNINAFWNAWRRHDGTDALRVNDATVRQVFGPRWGNYDFNTFIRNSSANAQVGVFKLFTRGKELGLKVSAHDAAAYARGLPASVATAAVLHRFAQAFGVDPKTMTLGSRALSEWPARVPGTPLGDVSEFENNSGAWHTAASRGDKRAFQITDATLDRLASDGYTSLQYWIAGPKETALDALKAFERLAVLHPDTVDGDSILDDCARLTGSKDIAKALQRIGKVCGVAVDDVVVGDKSVRAWLGTAAASSTPARAGKPLGAVRTWERDHNYNAFYNTARQDPRATMAVTDATLQKWFAAWGPGTNLNDYASDGVPETGVAYALWWARGKELGLNATCDVRRLQEFADYMPATAAAAQALRRLGRAFGFSVEHLALGGSKKVSSYAAGKSGASATPTLPPRPALGDTKMLKADLQAALSKKDPALFAIDDASLKRLLAFDPQLTGAMGASRDRAWRLGVLALADRAHALGAFDGSSVQALIQQLPLALCEDPAVPPLLAALVVKSELSLDSVAFSGGEPLGRDEATAGHVHRLLRVLEGVDAEVLPQRLASLQVASGPLGKNVGPYTKYWNQRDPGMFALDDASIRREMMTWGDFSWLDEWNNAPGVISLIARIVELNETDGNHNSSAKAEAVQWLAAPIPEVFGSADALVRVVRLCKATGVDPKGILVEHKGGRVPLLKHPELARLHAADKTGAPARAELLAADVAMLSPTAKTRGTNGGPAHPAEREAAVLRLLGVTNPDAPVVHELQEIFAAVMPALAAGDFTRLDLKRLPGKHKDALLATAFSNHDHPAAIALLAGVFFDADAPSIERVLLNKGHLAKTASDLGAVAQQLARASVAELAFCMAGLGAEPPELASLPLRAWLLTRPAPAELFARVKADADAAPMLCALMLEEATLPNTKQERRTALLDVVKTAEKQELVAREPIVGLLSDRAKRALDGDTIALVQDAVTALLAAPAAAVADARTHLASVFALPTWTQDPNVLADAALQTAAAIDLQFVAPLGAVDVKGGGVAGKAWQSRLMSSGPRVEVAGVKLPVETANGRAPKAGVSVYPAPEGSVAETALRLVATRWLTQRPFSIVDVDGPAALRAVAQRTGAALTGVRVASDATLDALVGPAGSISKALAAGGVVHLTLQGDAWPDGLAAALSELGAPARVVTTGLPLPGLPALNLPPVDADGMRAHGEAHGLTGQQASLVGDVFVAMREETGIGLGLALVERIGARLRLVPADGRYEMLQLAITQLARGSLPAHTHAKLSTVLRNHIGANEADASLSFERRTARLGAVPLKIVTPGVKESDVPPLTDAERGALQGAAWALELKEPVLGGAEQIEKLGVAYGAITGRDVHVHMLYAGSKPSDVVSARVNDVVIVAHGFAEAPEATQAALLAAAQEGRIRLLVENAARIDVPGAFALAGVQPSAAAGAGAVAPANELAARARVAGRALGLPDIVSDGACAVIGGIQRDIKNGELVPLVKTDPGLEIDALLALLSDLMRALPLPDAFVSAVSATFPMSEREYQDKLEADARAVVDA